VSPRKSSTSSGRPTTYRPRYLGIEVAGEPFPRPSPRWWEATLRAGLERAPGGIAGKFRLIRADGRRAVAEVDHRAAAAARSAWNGPAPGAPQLTLSTRRTWGTLVGAKRWMRHAGGVRPADPGRP
jgi:hypothetical protein